MTDEDGVDAEGLRREFEKAKADVEKLGGWRAFKSGDWLLSLTVQSFRNYYGRATEAYFRNKYPGKDSAFIAKKLVSVACRNAVLVGAFTGAAVTTDEVVAFFTGAAAVVGLPANIAIAAVAIAAESVLLLKIQMRLVAELASLSGIPLDPEDPEDILTILAFALGGSTAEAAGKAGMKIGGHAAGEAVRKFMGKEVLKSVETLGKRIGVTILQKQLVKYAIPVVSIGIGAGWNYASTRTIAKIANRHLAARKLEREPH